MSEFPGAATDSSPSLCWSRFILLDSNVLTK